MPFAGWEMPVQYRGIVEEHKAVRQHVGVFDISHMGQFLVEGADALTFLNRMLTNNVELLAPGQGQYTLLLNEGGGVIDDLIAYRLSEHEFFLVVNASHIEEDLAWLKGHLGEDKVRLLDISAQTGGPAVQGPDSKEVFHKVFGEAVRCSSPLEKHDLREHVGEWLGVLYLCGTGYTGARKVSNSSAPGVGDHENGLRNSTLRRLGKRRTACGGSAPGTLCAWQMGYPLNGNDLAPDKTALEAGLGFFVDL